MRNLGPILLTCLTTGFSLLGLQTGQSDELNSIQPWSPNPSYWQFNGEPVVLAGGSDDDNLFQWLDEPLLSQLDLLQSVSGNYLRNTMSDRHDKGFEVYPFKQLPDGRYDLEQWNEEYWRRFSRFLRWTSQKAIVVQIEVWDRFDYSREHWIHHPYNPANNVNYTYGESGFEARYPEHPGQNLQPFFFTTPEQRNNDLLLRYQERFVDKLLSYSLDYSHILYCIDNETRAEAAWPRYWNGFIRERATERGVSVYITEMWDDWDIRAEQHRETIDHPDIYDFADLSQNNHNSGDLHWKNAVWARDYVDERQPRPINSVKVYGADGNKFGHSDQDGLERFWRHILAGFAAVRFHRPDSGLGLGLKAQASIRSLRELQKSVDLWELKPANHLLKNREENEAYLACKPGGPFVLFFPAGGAIDLELNEGIYEISWIDVAAGRGSEALTEQVAEALNIETPGPGLWLSIIRSKTSN